MKLSLDQDGKRYTMEVVPASRHIKLPEEISGVRHINRVMLHVEQFDRFIAALSRDDFELIQEIMSKVVDIYTKELVYSRARDIRMLGS